MSATMSPVTDEAELRALLEPIRERNRGKLVERLSRVRAAAATPGPLTATEQLRADLHALVGALGTFGWVDGSQLLRQVQDALAAGEPGEPFVAALDRLIGEIGGASA